MGFATKGRGRATPIPGHLEVMGRRVLVGKQARRQAARRQRAERVSVGTVRPEIPSQAGVRSDESCPRCGAAVLYAGRGRRPIWCSARCRTAASIERKGNRLAGVQPRVVEVVRVREATSKPTAAPARRQVGEWAQVLVELRAALASGSLYDRELLKLVDPLNGVLEAFQRRSRRC